MAKISRERAERIAKGHACSHCQEYSYKRIAVKPASESVTQELSVIWIVTKLCGVCGVQSEIGLAEDGDIIFEG